MASGAWYAALDGAQAGPFSTEEINGLKAEGRVDRDTLVWRQGMADWMPAGTTELFPGPDTGTVAEPAPEADFGPAPQAAGPTSVPHVAPTEPAAEPSAGDGPEPVSPAPTAPAPEAPAALRGASFGEALSRYFARYVTFSGRASRSEYWWAFLFVAVTTVVLSGADMAIFGPGPNNPTALSSLFGLATFLPSLAVSVRRLHDLDRSGWWVLLIFIPLVGFLVLVFFFYVRPGTQGSNRFGDTRAA